MIKLTEKKTPEIIFKAANELTKADLIVMINQEEQNRENFFMFMRMKDTLYINNTLQADEKLLAAIKEGFQIRYSDEGLDPMLDYVKSTYGDLAENAFYSCWRAWRKERNRADDKEAAEEILKKCRELDLEETAGEYSDLATMCYEIGDNFYSDEKSDYTKGVRNAFMYGYLIGNGADGELLARNLNCRQMAALKGVQRSKYMMMLDIDMLKDEELVNGLYGIVKAYVKMQYEKQGARPGQAKG